MSVRSWLLAKFGRGYVERGRRGKEGPVLKSVLKALDGYKRVIVLATYLVEGFCHAMGWGDHTQYIGWVIHLLSWDGLGIDIGEALQNGGAVWAIWDGLVKRWREDREKRRKVLAARLGKSVVLLLLLLPSVACYSISAQRQLALRPSQDTVNKLYCLNQEVAAEQYLDDPSFRWIGAERIAYTATARSFVLAGKCDCARADKCRTVGN